MKKSDFYYDLPESLIAQTPAEKRDESRLLVLSKASGKTEDRVFYNILDYLKPGDCLVLNNTRVLPARLYGKKGPIYVVQSAEPAGEPEDRVATFY